MATPRIKVFLSTLIVLTWAAVASPAMASDFDAALVDAEKIRTSSRAEFKRLVDQLQSRVDEATPAQRNHLRLLRAYQMVLSGELSGAVDELKSLSSAKSADDVIRFRAEALLANAYAMMRQFSEGLTVLESLLPKLSSIENSDARHQGLLAASILYNQVGQYALGKEYALKVLQDSPNGRSACFANNLRLEALSYLGSPEEDAAYFAAIKRCQNENETIATNLVRSYLARKWHAQGMTKKAVELLETNLEEAKSTKYPHLIGEFHALMAEYRMSLGMSDLAERSAEAVVALDRDLTNTLSLATAYGVLYRLADAKGDTESALHLYKKFAEADKAYLNEVKARELAFQLVRQETLQQAREIELLNRRNEVLQLQQQVQKKSAQNNQLIVALLLLVLASIGVWAYKTKRLQLSLKRMAETDALTGICNRHHFTHCAQQALAQAAKSGEGAALVMFDLDHFKSVNDCFGHGTGDWVLKRVAEACAPLCRSVDYFGRIGGEEFAILLVGCDLHTAKRVADDCRARLSAIETIDTGHVFRVTASFGLTTTDFSGYGLTRLLSHADKMMYRAKRGGRNRLCVYDPLAPAAEPAISIVEMPQAAVDQAERSAQPQAVAS